MTASKRPSRFSCSAMLRIPRRVKRSPVATDSASGSACFAARYALRFGHATRPCGPAWGIERPARLVYLSSSMHHNADANLDDVGWTRRRWSGATAYAESKLHDVQLAFAAARR